MDRSAIDTLRTLMAQLRDPERGCPWDVAQTPESIVPFTIEEAYEVADAVERGDADDLRDELGDLLLQVVFQARMAEEAGLFGFDDVAAAIVRKLIRRHAHVFDADGHVLPADRRPTDPAAVKAAWERIKAEERAEKGARAAAGPLGDVPLALPALTRAEKVSRKAAGHGFDWPDAGQVVAKVHEEAEEVAQALGEGNPDAVAEEIGDLLFAVVNWSRHLGVDAEAALRSANAKFEHRFRGMETLDAGFAERPLEEQEALWQRVKAGGHPRVRKRS